MPLRAVFTSLLPDTLQKGGVPAAPSGTATLLRLSPSHRFYPGPILLRLRTLGTPNSHGLTGGVYKARERIHRAMADARLLANPASRSRGRLRSELRWGFWDSRTVTSLQPSVPTIVTRVSPRM